MSDFTIEQSQPQYNPWSPLQAMGQIGQQNTQIAGGQIANQSALMNLQMQRARQAPILSALQSLSQPQDQSGGGLSGAAMNAPPVGPPSGGSGSGLAGMAPGSGSGGGAPGSPAGGGGVPPNLAPGGPPPGTSSSDGSDAGGGYALPAGAGDAAQRMIGVAVPTLALVGAISGTDPTGDIQKLVATRAQWLETGAQQANTPQAWNSFVMSAYQNGWATSADASRLLNNFGMRDSVLRSYASPDEQLKSTTELAGQGMGVDPGTGAIGPYGPAIAAKGDVAGAEQTGRNQSDLQYKPAIAGATTAATDQADAPYRPPISIQVPVPGHPGSFTTEQVPASSYATTIGAGNGGGGAAPGGASLAPTNGPNPTNPFNLKVPGTTTNQFQTFVSPVAGAIAASDQLQSYGKQGADSVQAIVSKYAPASDGNNTSAYIAAVAKTMGVDPGQKLDLNDPNVRYRLLQAMGPLESKAARAALAGMGGGGTGGAPAPTAGNSGSPAAGAPTPLTPPPPAPRAAGIPSASPNDPPIPTNPVAGPPLPASNTGSNPNVIPAGITPGPGQVNAPPVPAMVPNPAAPGTMYQPAVGPAAAPAPAAPAPARAAAPALPDPLPQGTGFAPPAPPPGMPAGTIMGGYSPGPVEQEEIKQNLTANTEYQTDLRAKAQAASQQNAIFDQISQQTSGPGGFTPGGFAPVIADARKALDSTASLFGIKDGDWNAQPLASYQAYQKNVGLLSREAAQSLGDKTGVQELAAITSTLPSSETSPEGVKTVTAELQGMNDYMIAKAGAAARYSGNPSTFDAAYNANVSPTAFIMQRIGQTQGMPALVQMLQGIAQQPNGAAIVARMKAGYLYAQRDGLFSLAGDSQ